VRASLILVALLSMPARAENKPLAKAIAAYDGLKFAEAAKALDAAWKVPDNDRASVLKILELSAITHANLQHAAKAEESFRLLFALQPDFKLSREMGPRVMTSLYQAKSWVTEHGHVELSALPVELDGSEVKSVGVQLSDAPKLVQNLRLHVRDAGGWRVEKAPSSAGKLSATVRGTEVHYWAEGIGERGAQLVLLGSEDAPIIARVEPPAPPPDTPRVESKPELEPDSAPPAVTAQPTTTPSMLRPIAYGVAGAAVVSLIVGAVFGSQWSSAHGQLANPTLDSAGNVISPNEPTAQMLTQRMTTSGIAADVLFPLAGALAVTAVLMWFLGAPGG
jgi:hypothetical protein